MILCLTILCSIHTFAAEEKPAEPNPTASYRILGLCSPERQDDLREVASKIPGMKLLSSDFENGEVTLSYDQAVLFTQPGTKPNYKPEQITERLDNQLRAGSGGGFTLKPLSTTPKEKLTKVEIPILLLDCKGCRLGAYNSISKIDGVERAFVSSEEGLVTALIDPAKTNRAALEEALKKARIDLKTP